MSKEKLPEASLAPGPDAPKLPEPGERFLLRADSGWWFTVAAYAAGILVFALPPITEPSRWKRVAAGASMMAGSFFVVWLVRWLINRSNHVFTRWMKGSFYDQAFNLAAQNRRNLEATQELVRRMFGGLPIYTEIECSMYGGRVMLGFSKKGKRALPSVGQVLDLVDLEGGSVLGTFEVTVSDTAQCQAQDRGDLDAIFRGYAIDSSARYIPNDMGLCVLPKQEE